MSVLESYFKLRERGTTVRTEVIAGFTTFMTMSYIIFVNPGILKAAGVPFAAAVTGTALAAALATLMMGLYSNYPFALASGMGLNAALAFGLVAGLKVSWQTAMGVVVAEGILVTIFVLTNVREAVMNAIPLNLKRSIGVGIGLFIAVIGLSEGKFLVSSPATIVTFNPDFVKEPVTAVAIFGLVVTGWMMARGVKGAILLGILLSTVAAVLSDAVLGTKVLAPGALQGAAQVVQAPRFDTLFQFDLIGALQVGLWASIFAFMITDFFDTMGTVVAIGGEAGFLDKGGRLPRLKEVLLTDSLAAIIGGAFGVSSVTTYVESASGVGEGGRTGLTSVVVAILFALSIFFAPIVGLVPSAATAPALIIVGFLMMSVVKDIPFGNFEESFPAFLTMITIPLTYSIARGIGYGFILYTLIKLLRGKAKEVHLLMYIVSVLFVVAFWLGK